MENITTLRLRNEVQKDHAGNTGVVPSFGFNNSPTFAGRTVAAGGAVGGATIASGTTAAGRTTAAGGTTATGTAAGGTTSTSLTTLAFLRIVCDRNPRRIA